MANVKNFYTANSAEPGDVFLLTLKVTVQYDGSYRMYRCPYTHKVVDSEGVPQGDRVFPQDWFNPVDGVVDGDPLSDVQVVAEKLMPVLRAARKGPDMSR